MTDKKFEYIEGFLDWCKGKKMPLHEALASYGMEKRESASKEDLHELASALVFLSVYYPLISTYIENYIENLISVLQTTKK